MVDTVTGPARLSACACAGLWSRQHRGVGASVKRTTVLQQSSVVLTVVCGTRIARIDLGVELVRFRVRSRRAARRRAQPEGELHAVDIAVSRSRAILDGSGRARAGGVRRPPQGLWHVLRRAHRRRRIAWGGPRPAAWPVRPRAASACRRGAAPRLVPRQALSRRDAARLHRTGAYATRRHPESAAPAASSSP